jgi:hypothetical protein
LTRAEFATGRTETARQDGAHAVEQDQVVSGQFNNCFRVVFLIALQLFPSCVKRGDPCLMSEQQINNPLHGVTLEQVVESLVQFYGWRELGQRIDINCFRKDPSVKSSLKFLRKTPWARKKVEDLYLVTKQKS